MPFVPLFASLNQFNVGFISRRPIIRDGFTMTLSVLSPVLSRVGRLAADRGKEWSTMPLQCKSLMSCARLLLLLALLTGSCTTLTQDLQTRDDGPKNLFITYRCTADNRAALREYMMTEGLARLAAWKKESVFGDYKLLFNWFVDAETWDAMAILTFSNYEDVLKWRSIERTSPGGLSKAGLALATPVMTYATDLMWHGESTVRSDPSQSVYLIIPYTFYPPNSVADYIKYATTYVIPQVEGWITEGILTSYRIYVNRFPSARPWQSIFVLEYKDIRAFAVREKIVSKVSAGLKDDPAWKAYSDNKLKFRTEKETVTAEELQAR
jgi:hypothetical protein